jgi:hypothetical protein
VRTMTISPDVAAPSEVAQNTYLGLDPPGTRTYSNHTRRPTAPMSLLPSEAAAVRTTPIRTGEVFDGRSLRRDLLQPGGFVAMTSPQRL